MLYIHDGYSSLFYSIIFYIREWRLHIQPLLSPWGFLVSKLSVIFLGALLSDANLYNFNKFMYIVLF